MTRVLAIGASSAKKSINRHLVGLVAGLMEDVTVTRPDLNDYEMPIYSVDREAEGIP